MHPAIQLNPLASGQNAAPALLFPLADDSAASARVTGGQKLLFGPGPEAVCNEIGLNWWTALRLHEDGWLSFAPDKNPRLDESQEVELRFVGSLVVAGCDREMLQLLLHSLPRPYAYDLDRLFFDWTTRRWRALPVAHSDRESAFAEWLRQLVQQGDVPMLLGIAELAEDALARLRPELGQRTLD